MKYALVQNLAGKYVEPNGASFQAAAASADWAHASDFYLLMTDAPGDGAYPIAATTFILMYKQPKDEARSKETLAFFKWAFENGAPMAEKLDYVALPPVLVKQIEAYWAAEIH